MNSQQWNDLFNSSFASFIEPASPTISLDLTQEEIELCKRYAKARLLQERPELNEKALRSQQIEANSIVRLLVKYFEERQADILKTK